MLAESAFFLAYFVFSAPFAKLIEMIGYKQTMVVSLFIQVVGCLLFIPAAKLVSFPLFLAAVFIVGAGVTGLQNSANPYVAILGPEHSAPVRLTLAQALNSVGATIAPIIAGAFILTDPAKLSSPADVADTVRGSLHVHRRWAAGAGPGCGFHAPAAISPRPVRNGGKRRRPCAEPQHLGLQAHGAGSGGHLPLRGRGSGPGFDCGELLQDAGDELSSRPHLFWSRSTGLAPWLAVCSAPGC